MQHLLTRSLTIPPTTLESWCTMMNLLLEYLSVSDVGLWRPRPSHTDDHKNPQFERILHAGNGDCDIYHCHQYVSQVAQENRLIYINESPNNGIPYSTQCQQALSYIGVPIVYANNRLFGVLCVCSKTHNSFTPSHFKLLKQFKTTFELQLNQVAQNATPCQAITTNYQHQVLRPLKTSTYTQFSQTLNREIDKRIKVEKQLYFHKFYDLGTGFFNRMAFERKLISMIGRLANKTEDIAVIYVGFDNGRNIQHRYGASYWDAVLRQFKQQTLLDKLSNPIITGRASSSDIWLIYQTSQLEQDVDYICKKLNQCSQFPINVNGQQVHLHINIGVSTTQCCTNATKLLEQSAVAMMACRESAEPYCYHSKELLAHQAKTQQMESYLLNALRNHALTLYYQPKVDPKTHRWIGAEALLRWKHPILGEISDETLIHLAEKNGLIYEVGNFALRQAIAKASLWCQYIPEFKIAVNASARQLKDERFLETVTQLLDEYQLPAKCLEIEMTESGVVTDEKNTKHTLNQLHYLGVTLSLDDFGTGFASFSYLKKYPFDGIKIDKSFIQSLDKNTHDRDIVSSTINIAKKMGLNVTIEGIETKEQEAFVVKKGGDYGQGYLYGRPMPEEKFELELLEQDFNHSPSPP